MSDNNLNNAKLILVVDDHESQRTLFKLIAEQLQISVHAVASGEEAIEAVSTFRFSAVLMDILMPKMDGFQCTREIRKLEKSMGFRIPIIAVTACVEPEYRTRCLEAGMDDYLAKPFALEDLDEKLKHWIASDGEALPTKNS